MDISKPILNIDELKEIDFSSCNAIEFYNLAQSFLIHVHLNNITPESFQEIRSNIVRYGEALVLEDNTLLNDIRGSFEEVKDRVQNSMGQSSFVKKILKEKISLWTEVKRPIDQISKTILAESDDKNRSDLYVQVGFLIANYLDTLNEFETEELYNFPKNCENKIEILVKRTIEDLEKQGLIDTELESLYLHFNAIKRYLILTKDKIRERYPDLDIQNPYAFYTESDYKPSLRMFKKAENKEVFHVLLLILLEEISLIDLMINKNHFGDSEIMNNLNFIARFLGTTFGDSEIMNMNFIVCFLGLALGDIIYWNRIDDYLSIKETRNEKIKQAYTEYQEKRIALK